MNEDWNGVSIMRNDREVFFGYPHPWTGGLDLNQPRGRWIGFEIPDEFVVGYGIDYAQRDRNLSYIGKVRFY